MNFLNGIIHLPFCTELVSQQYRAWPEYMVVQAGLALYWWQRQPTFGFIRIRVNMIKRLQEKKLNLILSKNDSWFMYLNIYVLEYEHYHIEYISFITASIHTCIKF